MREYAVRVHYYENPDLDDDFVKFIVPENVSKDEFFETIIGVKRTYSEEDHDDMLEMTDSIMQEVASTLNGTWEYVPTCCTVVIGYDE